MIALGRNKINLAGVESMDYATSMSGSDQACLRVVIPIRYIVEGEIHGINAKLEVAAQYLISVEHTTGKGYRPGLGGIHTHLRTDSYCSFCNVVVLSDSPSISMLTPSDLFSNTIRFAIR